MGEKTCSEKNTDSGKIHFFKENIIMIFFINF